MWNIRILIVALFFCYFANGQMVINSYRFGDGLGPELYTVANALSRTNESDATTGLTATDVTLASIESSPSPQDGTSLISVTSTEGTNDRMEEVVTIENGAVYVIKYWAWESSGSTGRSNVWVGFSDFSTQEYTETPTEYTHTLTSNATSATLRFYATALGNVIYIDGLSIKKQL